MHLSRRFMIVGATVASGVTASAWLVTSAPGGSSPPGGAGARNGFVGVAVLGASRYPHRRDAAHAGGHAHYMDGVPVPSGLAHGVWTDEVQVTVELTNGRDVPLLFAPGQFRLHVDDAGASVAPYGAQTPPVSVPARTTLRTWVSYLAPAGAGRLSVEFTEAGSSRPLAIALDQVTAGVAG